MKKQKILIILGPTASGKSDLAVKLAEQFNGEIISADSRQVYKGLDIGTGKITQEEMNGITHYCLDIADPHERFSVSDWKSAAEKAIGEIVAKGKLPIICGGTGFYIDALVDDLEFQEVTIDPKVQKEFEKKSVEELFAELEKINPERAKAMSNGSDNKNKRRLIRSIMITKELGSVPPLKSKNIESKYDALFIGVAPTDEELKDRIHARLIKRIEHGMIQESAYLHAGTAKSSIGAPIATLSYERMTELGLEYKYLAELLQEKLTQEKLIETLSIKIWQYSRRQKTWFSKNEKIKWFGPEDLEKIKKEISLFI